MANQQFRYSIADFTAKSISFQRKILDHDYRLHWHECCETELVLSGGGTQILNGTEYPLRPGDLYLLTPADCHSVHAAEPTEVVGVMFEEKLLSQSIYNQILTRETLGFHHIAHLSEKETAAVRGLFEALEFNFGRDEADVWDETYIGSLLDCILIELLRCCKDSTPFPAKSAVSEAILYIHAHFTEAVTLTALAELTHLSPNYFSELFRETTGRNFKSYLIELRLRSACRMLANTDLSVTEVCYSSGFESFSNFMRTFKARFGDSPLHFRTENRPLPPVPIEEKTNKSEKTQ